MSHSPFDCVVLEAHRDSFEVTKRRRAGEAHGLAEGLVPRFIKAGYDIIVFIVGGDSVTHRDMSDRPLEGSLDVLDFVLNELQASNGQASLIRYKEDVPTAPDPNHVWFFAELEGGRPLQEDYSSGRKMNEKLAALRCFYRLGVRGVQLTHNGRNELADGMFDERTGGGISNFGVAVIKEMNRLGMLVGVSHLTDRCMLEAIEISDAPVFASHCNARAIYNHGRNLTDEMIRALNAKGGMMGIHFWAPMLCEGRHPTLDDFVSHIDYVSELVGPQCLGFGILGNDAAFTKWFPHTFIDTILTPEHPQGMEFGEQAALLMEELDKRGYSTEDIYGIMGGNYARVMRQVLPARGCDAIL